MRSSARRNDRHASCPRRSRGVVLIMVLLALVFVLGLIAYVFNIGRLVSVRSQTQAAADAASVSGPGYFARGLNTVAMSNVGQAHLLAMVNNLDAAPTAVSHTLEDQSMVLASLNRQLANGVPVAELRVEIQVLRDAIDNEVQQLTQLDAQFTGLNVDRYTHWNGPVGRGEIWRAMQSLDHYSQATAENLGPLAQVAAVQTVEGNLGNGDPTATGLMLPIAAEVPIERGHFDDFENPVRYGQNPEGARHRVTRRGPFDTLFGWRDGYYAVALELIPGTGGGGNGAAGSGWSGRGNRGGGLWRVTSRQLIQYGTFGTHDAVLRHLAGAGDDLQIIARGDTSAVGLLMYRLKRPLTGGGSLTPDLQIGDTVPTGTDGALGAALPWSRISMWHRRVAQVKADMGWPGTPPFAGVINPEWISDRDEAILRSNTPGGRFVETAYARIIFVSTFVNGVRTNGPTHADTDILWQRGWWREPAGLDDTQVISSHIWHDPIRDSVTVIAPDGTETITETLYDNYFIWLGANVGDEEDLDNPYEGITRSVAPAPIDFDHARFPVDSENRDGRLTFLSLAQRDFSSRLMPGSFDRGRITTKTLALAQSRVFNNHSHDLWTQMWRVQLEPIEALDDWSTLLESSRPVAAANPVIDQAALDQIARQLRASDALTESMLRH